MKLPDGQPDWSSLFSPLIQSSHEFRRSGKRPRLLAVPEGLVAIARANRSQESPDFPLPIPAFPSNTRQVLFLEDSCDSLDCNQVSLVLGSTRLGPGGITKSVTLGCDSARLTGISLQTDFQCSRSKTSFNILAHWQFGFPGGVVLTALACYWDACGCLLDVRPHPLKPKNRRQVPDQQASKGPTVFPP